MQLNLELYDYDTVLALSGAHLYWLYKKVFPIISKCRSVPGADKESRYAAFEALALRIKTNFGNYRLKRLKFAKKSSP